MQEKCKKYLRIPKKSSTFAVAFEGELSEWSKEPHSKCGVRITSYRGFESLTLRKRCKSMVYSVRFIKSGKNRVKLKFIYPFSVFYKLLKYSAL